jgi:hypothetical protein
MAAAPPPLDWELLIGEQATLRGSPVRADMYVKRWASNASPVLLISEDGLSYVVKGGHAGRVLVNDHIVAHLGLSIGAPCGDPKLVEITPDLIAEEPRLQEAAYGGNAMQPGVWHGSGYVPGYSRDRQGVLHTTVAENRSRFAALALLYGWVGTWQDHQFLYRLSPPPLVLSVDHGHFFPQGPEWNVGHLAAPPNGGIPDPALCSSSSLTHAELDAAADALRSMDSTAVIARAVASPPDHWGLSMPERVALAEYLARRYEEILAYLLQAKP